MCQEDKECPSVGLSIILLLWPCLRECCLKLAINRTRQDRKWREGNYDILARGRRFFQCVCVCVCASVHYYHVQLVVINGVPGKKNNST